MRLFSHSSLTRNIASRLREARRLYAIKNRTAGLACHHTRDAARARARGHRSRRTSPIRLRGSRELDPRSQPRFANRAPPGGGLPRRRGRARRRSGDHNQSRWQLRPHGPTRSRDHRSSPVSREEQDHPPHLPASGRLIDFISRRGRLESFPPSQMDATKHLSLPLLMTRHSPYATIVHLVRTRSDVERRRIDVAV